MFNMALFDAKVEGRSRSKALKESRGSITIFNSMKVISERLEKEVRVCTVLKTEKREVSARTEQRRCDIGSSIKGPAKPTI